MGGWVDYGHKFQFARHNAFLNVLEIKQGEEVKGEIEIYREKNERERERQRERGGREMPKHIIHMQC